MFVNNKTKQNKTTTTVNSSPVARASVSLLPANQPALN
jgi:hypothetical protein